MTEEVTLVCRTCSWVASTENNDSRDHCSRAAIDHHGRTGHTIEALDDPTTENHRNPSTETGWASEWPPEP